MTNYIIALVLGVFFGFSLNKAGLTKYHKIVNVFRFTDLAVLKFMMTALVVSMAGLYSSARPGAGDFPGCPGHLHRWQPDRRVDFWGRHGPGRVLTGYLRRRERRRKIRLFDPWNVRIFGRCSSLGVDLSAGFPKNFGAGKCRECRHAGALEFEFLSGCNPLCFDFIPAFLSHRSSRDAAQREEPVIIRDRRTL